MAPVLVLDEPLLFGGVVEVGVDAEVEVMSLLLAGTLDGMEEAEVGSAEDE